MAQSEALKIAKLEARTQLQSQVLTLLTDPLWSTIGGFVTVHELRRRDMIGPVADDILYAGIIAINTARTAPGVVDLAGRGLGTAGLVAAGYVASKVASKAETIAAGAGAGAAGGVRTVGKVALPVAITAAAAYAVDSEIQKHLSPDDRKAWRKVPLWKRLIPVIGQSAIRAEQKKIKQGG
jgi:hypothetical protein